MRAFAIDLYLWVEDLEDWLLVPPAGSSLRWPSPPGIPRAALVSSMASVTFRIDDALCLGSERDEFPLELIVFSLVHARDPGAPGALLASLPAGDHLMIEIRQGADERSVVLSRLSTRIADDYLERTAIATGAYFQDVAIDFVLWRGAIDRMLDGLALAFGTSPPSAEDPEDADLAEWLEAQYQALVSGPPSRA